MVKPVLDGLSRVPKEYRYELFGTVDAIPTGDWERAQDGDVELELSLPMLKSVESSMPEARLQSLIVYTGERPVAAAAMTVMTVDLLLLAEGHLRGPIEWVRRIAPNFLMFRMVMCGLPPTTGGCALHISTSCDSGAVLRCLDDAMQCYATNNRAQLIVLKEFLRDSRQQLGALEQIGYKRADSLADNYLDSRLRSFDDLLMGMRSRYRNQIRRSQKKFRDAGLEMFHVTDSEQLSSIYTAEVHGLHEQVRSHAEHVLERLPAEFFQSLCTEFVGRLHATLACDGDRVVGFVCGLLYNETYHSLFCGFDYQVNDYGAVYFNLMAEDVRFALTRGARVVRLGSTADRFKQRLACSQVPLDFYYRGSTWWFNLLGPFENMLFPPFQLLEQRHILADRVTS